MATALKLEVCKTNSVPLTTTFRIEFSNASVTLRKKYIREKLQLQSTRLMKPKEQVKYYWFETALELDHGFSAEALIIFINQSTVLSVFVATLRLILSKSETETKKLATVFTIEVV